MVKPWNKGFNKSNHPSVKKISATMKSRGLDNFREWRNEMKNAGIIKSQYPALRKNYQLAEFIGMMLGDGHIEKFPRTERLTLSMDSRKAPLIQHYKHIIKNIFQKESSLIRVKTANCTRLTLYEKNISKRLGIPIGNRSNLKFKIPPWISKNKGFLISYLRGLYEAEGCYCVHKPTCTHKLIFNNKNPFLLKQVSTCVETLGFHPYISSNKVQLSKQGEVLEFKRLINFRKY